MRLIIDVGNTRIKLAVFEKDSLLDKFVVSKKYFLKKINEILNHYPKIATGIISSVGFLEEKDLKKMYTTNDNMYIT